MGLNELFEFGKSVESWVTVSKAREIIVLGSLVLGISILSFNFFFFQGLPQVFTILNLLGACIATVPTILIKYREYSLKKNIEKMFPAFLNDVVNSIEAGMTLPQAIKNVSKNEYGPLTPYVKKMAIQIDWGIPFDEVLQRFSKRLRSKILSRAVSTIIETHRSGGNISDVLKAVSESIMEIERIREERKAHVYSQIVTGYVIYFVFLGVIIGLHKFLIPTLTFAGVKEVGFGGELESQIYKSLFQNLIIIQGFFSGLAIGKMSEGSIVAGLKHVVAFIAIGFTAFTLLL